MKQTLTLQPGSALATFIPMTPSSTPGVIPVSVDEDDDLVMADYTVQPSPVTPAQSPLPDEVSHSDDEEAAVEVKTEGESQTTPEQLEFADAATQTDEPLVQLNAMVVAASVQHRFAQLLEIGSREQVEHVLHQLMSAAVAYNPRPYLDDHAVRREPHSPSSSPDELED
jgi:hypothetical protein